MLKKKMMVFCMICFVSQIALAETLTVKMECKNGKCVPEQSQNKIDKKDINALRAQLNDAKGKLRKIDDVVSLREDIFSLKQKVKSIDSSLLELEKATNSIGEKTASLRDDVGTLQKEIESILRRIASSHMILSDRIRLLENETRMRFRSRKINLEIGTYGIFSNPFGFTSGVLLALDIPMGDLGSWHSFVTGGLGLSPSISLGYLTSLSVDKRINKFMMFGPSVLSFGDFRDMLTQKINWVAALGVDVRFTFNSVNLVIVPFVGFGPNEKNVSSSREKITYENTVCGTVVKKELVETQSGKERKLNVQGGFLVTLTYSLF